MQFNRNKHFLDMCTELMPDGGAYGDIKFLKNRKGDIFVEKSCKNDRLFDLASTTKEAFFLQYLSENEKEPYVPRLAAWCESEINKNKLCKMLTMQFVGPSLHECNILGFSIEPAWLLLQLMEACHFLEMKGVLHLEIKCNNVTYDLNANKIKLIDFGMSEFCLFSDLEKEGGLKTLYQNERHVIGRVKEDGFFSNYLSEGSLFLQSQFFRCEPRASRISIHTNSPAYRQLETLICQWFGIEKGLQVDAKFDVFSAAWTVLTHMIGHELHLPKYENELDLERERIGRSLFKILPSLLKYRGGCNSNEVYFLVSTVKHAMASLRKNLFEEEKRIGQLKAVETILKFATKEGSLTELSPVYGQNFVAAMRSALHPVKIFRYSSSDVMAELMSKGIADEKFRQVDVKVKYLTKLVMERYINCRVMKEDFCIASITIDIAQQSVLWSNLSSLKHLREWQPIWNEMIIKLHSKCCCLNDLHAPRWYLRLDTTKILNKFVEKSSWKK